MAPNTSVGYSAILLVPAISVSIVLASAGLLVSCSRAPSATGLHWNANAAAHYLDQREARWMAWPGAARDRGTFCVSCHTALPYALVRSEIQAPDADQTGSAEEVELVENVRKRVRLWEEVGPYYKGKEDESRGTEAVLNALILATYDARNGRALRVDARAAFDHMWAAQKTSGDEKGAWGWLQFRQEPWEAPDSVYYGACLAAVAVGTAPDEYKNDLAIRPEVTLLRDYLHRNYAAATTINRVTLLWASLKLPGLVSPEIQQSILTEVYEKQRADGGWSLATLIGNWKRTDGTPLVVESDGYATGLITYVLQRAGIPRNNTHLARGLAWLASNQNRWNGHWSAYSLNKRRHDPFSNASQFMNDAATAYAALSLAEARRSRDKATGR